MKFLTFPLFPQGNVLGAPMVDGVIPQMAPPEKYHHLWFCVHFAVDGNIYFSSRASNSILRLKPKELDASERWTNYPIKGDPYAHPSGCRRSARPCIGRNRKGNVGRTRSRDRKADPPCTARQAGAVHEVVVDKDGNVGFDLIWGAFLAGWKRSRRIHMYPTPTPDNGMYGLAADQHGNLWGAGWQKGTISKWDVETESVKEYKVPNSWGQVRRISVDSKGIVWASEYITGMVARLDPATGNLTEYKIPLAAPNLTKPGRTNWTMSGWPTRCTVR
jgi:hypothetical protein